MKWEDIHKARRVDQTLLVVDQWDLNAFESQLHAVPELEELYRDGAARLPTMYGLMLDLFTMLFAGVLAKRPNPRITGAMQVNAAILEAFLGLPELRALRHSCQYQRTAVTALIIRFSRSILDLIPDLVSSLALEAGEGQPQEGQDGGQPQEDTDGGAGGGPPGSDGAGSGDAVPDSGADAGQAPRSDAAPGEGGTGADVSQDGDADAGGGDQSGDGQGTSAQSSGSGGGSSQRSASGLSGKGQGGGSSSAGAGAGNDNGAGGASQDPTQGNQGDGGQPGARTGGDAARHAGGLSQESQGRGRGDQAPQLPQGSSTRGAGGDPTSGSGQAQGAPRQGQACSSTEQALQAALRRLTPDLLEALQAEVGEATEELQELAQIAASQGWDLEPPAGDMRPGNALKAWQAMRELMDHEEIRKLFRTFGQRLRTMALSAQERKPVGKGFIGIDRTVGDDISRIPPDELWPLAHPTTRVLLAQDIMDGTAPQVDFQEEFEGESGDVWCAMDHSWSTDEHDGRVLQFIKGATLGLQAICHAQKRECVVVPFNRRAQEPIDLTKPSLRELAALAEISPDGGTDFEAALIKVIEGIRKSGKLDYPPDVVMITDGQCPIPARPKDDEDRERRKTALKTDLMALGVRLKVIYVGIEEHELEFTDLREIAGKQNEFFLSSIHDQRGLEEVYQSL